MFWVPGYASDVVLAFLVIFVLLLTLQITYVKGHILTAKLTNALNSGA